MNTRGDDNRDRFAVPRALKVFLPLMFLSLAICACSTLLPPDQREEAARRYRYQSLRDELIVEPQKLSAATVRPGERIAREVAFTLLSPQKEKRFKVTEILTLSGPGLTVELSRQESDRAQGLHTSTLQVMVPKDLPSGVYVLTTTIATEEQQMTQKANFQVEK